MNIEIEKIKSNKAKNFEDIHLGSLFYDKDDILYIKYDDEMSVRIDTGDIDCSFEYDDVVIEPTKVNIQYE